MAFQLLALTGIWASCVSLFNAGEARKTQSELEIRRRETQLEMEYLRVNHQTNLESVRQAFQKKVVEYQCENSLRVQQFVKTVDFMLAKNQQEFQAWQAEQQRKLQQELAIYNRETQLAVAAYQRETAKSMAEFNKILDNWPLRLYPSEIIGSCQEKTLPLRVIIAPPEIDYDRFGGANKDFPKLEKRLAQGIREFVENYYPLSSQERPIEFLGGAWDSNRFHSEASIKRLFTMLKSEPTLILESEVDGEYINLRVAYWSGGQDSYGYKTVISKLAHLEIVKTFAKMRILQGKPNQELPRDTKIEHNAKDFEKICEFFIACHNLLTGLFTDVHYLIHENRHLQLPALLSEIMKNFPDHQVAKEVLEWVINGYQDAFKALEMDRSYWIPDLMLELAQGLVNLEDRSWAKKLIEGSKHYWLQLRGIVINEGDDLLRTMEPLLTSSDKNYLQNLKNCLLSVGDSQNLLQIENFLESEKTQNDIFQFNCNLITFQSETTRPKQEKMMDFRETKSKVLSVIDQLRGIAKVSVRNVLNDADGKFHKDLIVLEDQINTTRFTVGVVGVFNTGKSTFLNALLRRELLSTKILPETAAITSLKYSEEDKATVYYWTAEEWKAIESQGKAEDQGNKPSKITKMILEVKATLEEKFNQMITPSGEKIENIHLVELEKYTSANAKGGYAKLVREVEIATNLEFCKENIQIVDTPGLNDPVQFREHITVDKFLPRCDMLVLLLPAKQVFTKYDKDFLEKQLKKGQLHKLFVIVNQIDLLHANENVGEVIDFTRNQLRETFEECEEKNVADFANQLEIFPMSAYQSFLNRTGQPAKWTDEQSGVPEFETRLRQFLFEGERACEMQKIWRIRLKSFVESQLIQIDEHLANLDKPVAELEKYIKEVESEYKTVQLHFQNATLECNGIIVTFGSQYDAQAYLVETKIRELVKPVQEGAFKKLDDFLDSRNFVGAMKGVEDWSKKELATFLNISIKSSVESIMSDAQDRIKQLVIGVIQEVEASFQRMVENVRLSVPAPVSGLDWAGLAGRSVMALSAGLGANIIVATIYTHLTATVASSTALFFLSNPIGLAIIAAVGLVTFFVGGGIIKGRIRERLKATLPQLLTEKLGEIAVNQRNILMGYKSSLIEELRNKVGTPVKEIQNEMQQRQANLSQLLNDKKSQEVDIQKQREALVGEKARFEKVLVEINAMG